MMMYTSIFFGNASERMRNGDCKQTALAKLHSKNRCASVSVELQREQCRGQP
jgi:hypothetical protein